MDCNSCKLQIKSNSDEITASEVKMKGLIVSGIGTDVGKTVISAALCQALTGDYWKPVQSGTQDSPPDSDTVRSLIKKGESRIHPSSYTFAHSLSPHAAAKLVNVKITLDAIITPVTDKVLIVELAGGILVPLNDEKTNIDLIRKLCFPIILVANHYLGSINHTLLSIEYLKNAGLPLIGIIFNGEELLPETESIVLKLSSVPIIARVPILPELNSVTIAELAQNLVKLNLKKLASEYW